MISGEFTLAVEDQLKLQANSDDGFSDPSATGANLDPGPTVVDGDFRLNGLTIDVLANDSMNTILSKINISSSGVLSALKLDSANRLPGVDQEVTSPLTNVDDFSGVASGNFFINGQAIALDVSTDSLVDVLDRINTILEFLKHCSLRATLMQGLALPVANMQVWLLTMLPNAPQT